MGEPVPSDLVDEIRDCLVNGRKDRDRFTQLIQRLKEYDLGHATLTSFYGVAHSDCFDEVLDEAVRTWHPPRPPEPVKTPIAEATTRPSGESRTPQEKVNIPAPEAATLHSPDESRAPQSRPSFWRKLFGTKHHPSSPTVDPSHQSRSPAAPSASVSNVGTCDVCSAKTRFADAYALTTREVTTSVKYWKYVMKKEEEVFRRGGPEFLVHFVNRQASSPTGWLVCEECSGMFEFNKAIAREYAIRETTPPNSGPVDIMEPGTAALIAQSILMKDFEP